jgi:hypothetical protein
MIQMMQKLRAISLIELRRPQSILRRNNPILLRSVRRLAALQT